MRQRGHDEHGARAQGRRDPRRSCSTGCRGTTRWAATRPSRATSNEGGTTWIDDGKPLPGLFEETLRNLREVSPTSFSNVPAGYAMLATALEKDEKLAKRFFANINVLSYGGATLPDDLYERMEALAVKHTGYRIPFVTGWGSTETAPTATSVHWASERVGLIGLPYPGVQLKMVPTGEEGRYELRLQERDRDAGLLQAARPHGADVRRGRLLQDRRCRPLRRSRGSEPGPDLRRPRRRGFQADQRHLRAGRHAAHDGDRGGHAGAAGRRGLRPGPRVCRPAGLPQRRGLPPARRRQRRAAAARRAAGPSRRGRRP